MKHILKTQDKEPAWPNPGLRACDDSPSAVRSEGKVQIGCVGHSLAGKNKQLLYSMASLATWPKRAKKAAAKVHVKLVTNIKAVVV